jgi:hypothetical protein
MGRRIGIYFDKLNKNQNILSNGKDSMKNLILGNH